MGAQVIAKALEAVKGNVEDQAAFLAALKAVEVNGPRGKVRFDPFQNVVDTVHILKVERKGGATENLEVESRGLHGDDAVCRAAREMGQVRRER